MNATKDFFEKCRRLDARINAKLDELEHAKAQACRVTPSYTAQPRGGSRAQSSVESGVARMLELDRQINADIDEMVTHRELARGIVNRIDDDRYRDVLAWRYFSMWSWDRIADALGCDRLQAWRIHGRALVEANRLLDEARPNVKK